MKTINKNSNKTILCISDMHIPYNHPDTFRFLKAIKKKYKPSRVVCLGDEVDKHAMSFHDSDPDLLSAGDELKASIEILKPLYKLFPKVDLVDSNHGSMAFRKAKHHGIPTKYLKSYNDVLEAPKGWVWHNTLNLKLQNGQSVYFCHGMKKQGLALAQSMGCNVVQGHFHSVFNIQYTSSPSQLNWSLQVGCMLDDKSLAFEYNKVTPARPILGHGIIINGQPKLLPMILDENGNWDGEVY